MSKFKPALLLASTMIGIALLAVFDIIPEAFAQYSPFLLLALFPQAWLRRDRCCSPMSAA